MTAVSFDHAARLKRAAGELGEGGLDAVVVTPGPDLTYLVGYEPPPLERLTALLLRFASDPILLVPELERPRAAESPAGGLVEIRGWRDGENPHEKAAGILAGSRRVGISDRTWASHLLALQGALPVSDFVTGSRVLARLRVRKEPGEIDLLARAGRAADHAFERITKEPLAGRTEEEVAATLGELLLEAGHDSVGFTIIAAGPDGASPHHEPAGRTVEAGDALVMDFGGRVGGYCSDITRTVSVGPASAEVEQVHDVVRRAQQAAFDLVRPRVAAQDVDRAARSVIDEAGFGEFFVHRTGHGIGLEEHEDPYIVEGNTAPLEPGMCFSIEPGIYLPGRFGVRIEDIVTVTEDGAARLNEAPRGLLVVG
jgi:D-alanyl-D-alanine dipeptidase